MAPGFLPAGLIARWAYCPLGLLPAGLIARWAYCPLGFLPLAQTGAVTRR